MKRLLLCLLVCNFYNTYSIDVQQTQGTEKLNFASTNTYKGEIINAESILRLAPHAPEDVVRLTQGYLLQRPKAARYFSGQVYYQKVPGYDKAPFAINLEQEASLKEAFFGERKRQMDAEGVINRVGGPNFVIDLNPNWLLKVSGFGNRRENINKEQSPAESYAWGSSVSQDALDAFIKKGGKTYQTISRMAYWLRAKEAQTVLGLDRICLPEQYLVHIPDRPEHVDDTNYVIVEQTITGAKPLTETPLACDPEIISQLTQIIGYTALWDINPNNILASNNNACIVDTEQPNNHKPSDFFMEDADVFRSNVGHGWAELTQNIILKASCVNQEALLARKREIEEDIKKSWK